MRLSLITPVEVPRLDAIGCDPPLRTSVSATTSVKVDDPMHAGCRRTHAAAETRAAGRRVRRHATRTPTQPSRGQGRRFQARISHRASNLWCGPNSVAPTRRSWHTYQVDATLVLGQQGRLVIPAEVRAALGLAPGDQLHLHVAGSRLTLERPQDAVNELRALAKDVPKSRSLVEELLAERRLAAAAE